jgi:hypothetical protein
MYLHKDRTLKHFEIILSKGEEGGVNEDEEYIVNINETFMRSMNNYSMLINMSIEENF